TPPHGSDQRRGAVAVDLLPEPVDVDLDDVSGTLPVGLPEVLAEHGAGDDLAGVAHHHLQQAELGGGQDELPAAAVDPAGGQVEDEVADLQDGGGPVLDAAADGGEAGHQLGEGE